MNYIKHHIAFALFIFAFLTQYLFNNTLQAQRNIENFIKNADKLNHELKEPEALAEFLKAYEADKNNEYILWNISFLYSKIGFRLNEENKQNEYFNLAKEFAELSLKANPENDECNYVMAVAMGRIAEIAPVTERVSAARDIKKYGEKTLEINPNHALANHLLGKWHYRAANLSWPEQIAADLFFGGLGEASNELSVNYFKKAIQIDPNDVLFYLDLAIEYEEIDEDTKAIEILNKAKGSR
ncbi:MAG: hypothetical protein FD136_2077 [Chitinophagaceae bacterium]|nr:MAG: hypothetical protein FD136_2077 [Chitinophagaceae bacterium]